MLTNPRHVRRLTAISLAVLVAGPVGCMVGPTPTPPTAVLPDAWHASLVDGLDAEQAELGAWWRSFDDPLLTELVTTAERNNLDVRIAESRIREARAAYGIAAADLFPEVSLDGDATFRDGARFNGPLPSRTYSTALDFGWEPDLWGRVRRSMEAADSEVLATIEDRRDVLVSVRSEVARSYFEARALQGQLDSVEAEVASRAETLELVRMMQSRGVSNELDVSQAAAQFEAASAEVPPLRLAFASAVNRISVLLAEPAGPLQDRLVESFDPEHPVPSPPDRIAVGIPADTIRRRPDIRAAERRLMAAAAEIGVAEAALYPSFRITGSGGFSSTDFDRLFDPGSRGSILGLEISWPIFTAGRLQSVIRVRDEQADQALLDWELTVLEAMAEVENALVAYASTLDEQVQLAATVASYRRAAELARTRYDAGVDDLQTLLTIDRGLLVAVQRLDQVEGQLASNVVGLYKALGGAWNIEESTPRAADSSVRDASEESRG